jgi:hypothetical protein
MVKKPETKSIFNSCNFIIISIFIFLFIISCGKKEKYTIYSSFPFKLENLRIIVSPLLNHKHEENFLIDTSIEAGIIIDFRLAKKAGLKPLKPVDFYYWIRKTPKPEYYKLKSFGFPNKELKNLNCLVADLKILEEKLGERINGIIGNAFFTNFFIEFDFKTKMINLYSKPLSPENEYIKVKLDKFPGSENKRIITGVTDKNLVSSFILNTGSPVTIYPPVIAKELLKRGKAVSSHYIEISGHKYSLLKISNLNFNGIILSQNKEVIYSPPSDNEELPINEILKLGYGILGMDILGKGKWILNLKDNYIAFYNPLH